MKKILTSGTLSSYRPKVDGSFTLSVNITIPSKEQRDVIQDLFSREVVVYLRELSDVTEEEIAIVDNLEVDFGSKTTDHQRLTKVWYILWKDNPQGFKLYGDYYHFRMNGLIEHYKGKIAGDSSH